jgi:CspA family cold shock protein
LIARVREWQEDEGWGVVSSDEFPEGVWVHFSAVQKDGYKSLKPGEDVEIEVEDLFPADQDGYRYRATVARPL